MPGATAFTRTPLCDHSDSFMMHAKHESTTIDGEAFE